MKAFFAFLLLFSLFQFSSASPFNLAVTLSLSQDSQVAFFRADIPLLGTNISFSLSSTNNTESYKLCGLRFLQPPFSYSLWNHSVCSFFFITPAGKWEAEVSPGTYWLGIALNSSEPNTITTNTTNPNTNPNTNLNLNTDTKLNTNLNTDTNTNNNTTRNLTLVLSAQQCTEGRVGLFCADSSYPLDSDNSAFFNFTTPWESKFIHFRIPSPPPLAADFIIDPTMIKLPNQTHNKIYFVVFGWGVPLDFNSIMNNPNGNIIHYSGSHVSFKYTAPRPGDYFLFATPSNSSRSFLRRSLFLSPRTLR
eukprot:TRINITY_DN3911_c0_g2_i3.p1 TRINITY_DN3911_c0_g2~~TRINITY_DN3911_c0_g2_i3.p1  ORF type:complete len:325 (-),score=105.59 TRINITY_DN3911_c0_g2_i3:6-923(-)